MKFKKFFFGLLVVVLATFFIYSCAKENEVPVSQFKDKIIEIRSSGESECSPRTLYTEYQSCDSNYVTENISFSSGVGLFSQSSRIYQICPGLQVTVSYWKSKCYTFSGDTINFIHSLSYNLAQMIIDCPALQTEINNQYALGNLISFLDLIDHEIGLQSEYTLAYLQALNYVGSIDCSLNKKYGVKYIKNTCYRWVPFTDGPKDRPITAYKKESCGETVCCARTNSYCTSGYTSGGLPLIVTGTPTHYQNFEGTCPLQCTHDCGAPDPNEI